MMIRAWILVGVCVASIALQAADVTGQVTALAVLDDQLSTRLDQRIAASNGQLWQLELALPKAIVPTAGQPGRLLSIRIAGAGDAWAPGTGTTPKYNKGRHQITAADLRLVDGRLGGQLAVVIQPDGWVPKDGKVRHLTIVLDAAVADGQVTGTASVTGDFAAATSPVTGTAASQPLTGAPAMTPASRPIDAVIAHYQRIRSTVRCLRSFPAQWTAVHAGHPRASWQGDDPAAQVRFADQAVAYAEQAVRRFAEAPAIQTGGLDVGDPWFHPHGDVALATDGQRNLLPADVGGPGEQQWRFLSRWQLVAAWPAASPSSWSTPYLPPVLPAAELVYERHPDLDDSYEPEGATPLRWTDHTAPCFPIAPPGQSFHPRTGTQHGKMTLDGGVHGLKRGRWYAATTLTAVAPTILYAAILADDVGACWVNGVLVWRAERKLLPQALLRLPLVAGDNQIIIGCECSEQNTAIGLAVCTRGEPFDAAARSASLERTRTATAALPPPVWRGRHGDGTSRYPDATPPLAWDLRDGTNVKWRVELPEYSAAPPVVIGDVVFVNSEPDILTCLDRETGAIRWQRSASVLDFLPEGERAQARADWQRGRTVQDNVEVKALSAQLADLGRILRKDSLKESERDRYQGQQQKLKKAKQTIVGRLAGGYKSLKKRLQVSDPGWKNNYGWTMGAPVSDGRHVWVKYATGVAACFDMNGKKMWSAHTKLSGGVANISSPLLLDGKFVVLGKINDRSRRNAKRGVWPAFMQHLLIAYEADTGAVAWEQPVYVSGGYGGPSGMVAMRLANGTIAKEVILLGSGLVIDPRNGQFLSHVRGPGPSNWAGDPILVGNRAFFPRSGKAKFVDYILQDDGSVLARHVGETAKGVMGQPGSVYLNGKIYGNDGRGVGRQPVPWHAFAAVDVAKGRKVYSEFPGLRNGGLAYTPAAAAGDYAVLSGTGPGPAAWNIGPRESAEIGFVKDGPQPYLAATCQVQDEAMVAAPVFVDDCMYLRTYRSAVCIRVAGDDGQRLVDDALADTLLQAVPKRPAAPELIDVQAPPDWTPPKGLPVEPLDRQTAPQSWLFTGPLPLTDADPLAALGGLMAAVPDPAASLSFGEQTFAFKPVPKEAVAASKGWGKDMYDRPVYSARSVVDVVGAIGRKANSRTIYFTAFATDKPRIVEVRLKANSRHTFVLSGTKITDGMFLRLQPGVHPLLVQVDNGRIPPMLKKLPMGIFLADRPDPARSLTGWYTRLEAMRPRMEAVLADLGPGAARLRIMTYINILDNRK